MAQIDTTTNVDRTVTRQQQREHTWMYELRPSHDLPAVDLSVSIKSRFLTQRQLVVFSKLVAYHRLLLTAALFPMFCYPISLVLDPDIGRPLAGVSAVIGLPGAIAGVSLLRFELVRLLLSTYDTLFFLGMVFASFAPLACMLGDIRAAPIITCFVGLLPNIFIDANLRAVRRITVLTGVQLFTMTIAMMEIMLDLIPWGYPNLAVFQYGSHVVPAKLFVTNGMSSVVLLLLRNFYRNRKSITRRGNPSLQHCVSYRVRLHLCSAIQVAREEKAIRMALIARGPRATNLFENKVYVQQLRYERSLRLVDSRNALSPGLFRALIMPHPPESIRSKRQIVLCRLFQGCSLVAALFSLVANPIDRSLTIFDGFPMVQLVALVLTCAHWFTLVALGQRQLLWWVVTSFDVAYFSAHIVFINHCLGVFFEWSPNCLIVLIAVIWLHAIFVMDAITPPVRRRLKLNVRAAAIMFGVIALGGTAAIMYAMVFGPNSNEIPDRVVWTVYIGSATTPVEMTLMPFFYSSLLTAFLLTLRVLFRTASYAEDAMIFIDGPVMFNNCFHHSHTRMAGDKEGDGGDAKQSVTRLQSALWPVRTSVIVPQAQPRQSKLGSISEH